MKKISKDYNHKHLHELLLDIVEQFGEEILAESRLRGLISDLAAGSEIMKFQTVLNCSISNHIGKRLLQFRDLDEADFSLRLNTLKQSFQEENFLRHGVSDYIIDSYLYALGWIPQITEYQEDTDATGNGRSGQLSFIEWKGDEFCGNLSKENERSGFGISKQEDGEYYAGEWKLDMKSGVGLNVSSEREKFVGEWRFNRKNGVGISIQADGMRYSGEWKNGKIHGVGVIYYPNGNRLCSRFDNGKLCNEVGMFFLQDGTYIVGQMSMYGPNGHCIHYGTDGACKEEDWNSGIKE